MRVTDIVNDKYMLTFSLSSICIGIQLDKMFALDGNRKTIWLLKIEEI